MKTYAFKLYNEGDQLVNEGYGSGSNAMEAFETAVGYGTVILPVDGPVEVVAVNTETGVAIRFEAGRV